MMDHTELVKALRHCMTKEDGITICEPCPYYGKGIECENVLHTDAADAIERLIAERDEAKTDLAAVGRAYIREIEQHDPKLGEWQKAKPHGVVTYSDGYAECSHCHEAIWLGWGMNFCPNCGTQNKIIDPDDYDGAKMEVQE